MIPDPYKRTVEIPVRLTEGELRFFYGGSLPSLKNGTIGELIVPAYAVQDEYKLNLIRRGARKPFLKRGTTLLARLSHRTKNESSVLMTRIKVEPPVSGVYAYIELEEDLKIEMRGTKNPVLCRCECTIPVLDDIKARSINHAYTLLSEKFETHRITHTGNAFEQVYAQNQKHEWVQLKSLRDGVYHKFEYELTCLCKEWWSKAVQNNERCWSCIDQNNDNTHVLYEVTDKSVIVSERYFENEKEALLRLNRKGFKKYDSDDYNNRLTPPAPPYIKPGGKVVRFSFDLEE